MLEEVFPAQAGMSRPNQGTEHARGSVPRASGDEPRALTGRANL